MEATEVLPPKPRSADLRRWLGVSDLTIWRWRKAGRFPAPQRLGGTRTLFWDRAELLQWAAQREAKP